MGCQSPKAPTVLTKALGALGFRQHRQSLKNASGKENRAPPDAISSKGGKDMALDFGYKSFEF